MNPVGGVIETVDPMGLGARIGLKKGDILLTVNGQVIHDLLDYGFMIRQERVQLQVIAQTTGQVRWFEIEKDEEDDLSIDFAQATFDGMRHCHNHCLFCFVEQMPPGMRKSLYEKDDDYRYSFWHGSFITLTNLREEDFQKLLTLRLSPLYISVQATDGEVRSKLLGHKQASLIMERLQKIVEARIQIHCQIVACPGINDGEVLAKSLKDLWSLGFGLASVAVVPVGLTRFRENLQPLRPFQKKEAQSVIELIEQWQEKALEERGERIFFAADEFYLLAQKELPDEDSYDDYCQLENGVGVSRLFMEQWQTGTEKWITSFIEVNESSSRPDHIYVITGQSGRQVLEPLLREVEKAYGLSWSSLGVEIISVENKFFGSTVTVTGLLTGKDVVEHILSHKKSISSNDLLILPSIMFRADGDLTLDDMTVEEISHQIGNIPIKIINTQGDALLKALLWPLEA
ncbi:DUF512 domain-containing protein [Heliorestis acidaminivorans]|uniref:DUF512 domain-containing protein n=1 Tax=Heliorestis acidaminivorans TaxID=553427 RepID=A0A6I0F0T8_9FIRM|nr:DUF512 domain-containing protein [Heliorestis acidaminivorans]KAB2954586.1 DUF512 domain-containing protein [Heliorestis acidaminivorans]